MSATVTIRQNDGTTYTFASDKWDFSMVAEIEAVSCGHRPPCGWPHKQATGRKFVTIKAETPNVDFDAAS